MPPRWFRRIVLAPVALVIISAVLVTMPVWLLLAGALGPLGSGRMRALRVSWMVAVYLFLEVVALLVLFGLWVGSGFGWRLRGPRFQRAHYVLTGRFLRILYAQARWTLGVKVSVVGTDPDVAAPGRPELVFCRHAGPGDSFLLVHALVNWFDREPRIVLKASLQWDPVIDVMLNRLPNHFVTVSAGAESMIGRLATGLDHNDVLVLFPEGGNFTPNRREKAIQRLRDLGLHTMAERAERMRHVLAPRPGGTLAALDAAPEAGVIWVAHTGLDKLLSVADVWRHLPLDLTITMRWWSVDAEDVPAGQEERVDWLYEWWARIDSWIDRHGPGSGS
ncbi:lysophospholipid acyltransferase family protein [Dactylosporangium fulvum]|uniref:Lysophospholipid acyltransferase family protein n=1 Tax=Dactylosporangium fulvum TaxID=53359 RepID=A0ABY5W3U1_9ACTN|nr:lysophospholipid acyltransferase family protein [Dactylosporangium fulvum]UWP84678.1 lysophospholipid acyltransferase family protein [Dactylosporangium fulvum]